MTEDALFRLVATLPEPDARAADEAQRRLDGKTKPRGSLGRLEELARRLAGIQATARPAASPRAVVVMAADHGVASGAAGPVSAFPPEVTAQMVLNFAAGGAAINVLARQAGATLRLVDMGVLQPVDAAGVEAVRVRAGTRDFTVEPAMTRAEALAALGAGVRIADELAAAGVKLVALGEMGIGNSTAAAALTCAFTGADADEATGRGTGVDDKIWAKKREAVRTAVARHAGLDPLGTLAALGGLEIAGLAGLTLGCARARVPVLLDGYIASAAALAAVRLAPRAGHALVAAHRSVEPGHRAVLRALDLDPLLDLGLRLGEGSGAALALHLVDAAVHVLDEMATFEAAGVTDSGR